MITTTGAGATGCADMRQLLTAPDILAVPGAADALTARVIAAAGFGAVYLTGLGATATRLGMPDLGLMTQTEMAEHARSICRAVVVPVIADADTGYGGPLNIRRAVADYVQAGVAALHLEDQVTPKRCGQLAGIKIVPQAEAEARLRAALAARDAFGDIMIIARTDALPGYGMDAAVERAKRYAGLGVDLVFVDGVKTRAEVEAIAHRVDGPKVISLVDGTDAATLRLRELEQMGFALCLYAVTGLFAGLHAQATAFAELRRTGALPATGFTYAQFCDLIGLPALQEFAHRFETGTADE
ncbi:isocitrate lyase/PEP mutase family protein [Puniceibacterium confluentis]|uniref:isocitrate lyase/PEP mutase family protein n=1 Tax=Puniceibacterium confluentis TaxID=1958944 RepID=UPI001FE266C0|nr:isocitrate lyase/PEP mutase family protein [Puniceibacterium confluentis]